MFRGIGASSSHRYWVPDFMRNSETALETPGPEISTLSPIIHHVLYKLFASFLMETTSAGQFCGWNPVSVSLTLIPSITPGCLLNLSLLWVIICTIQVIATLPAAGGLN